MEYPKMGLNKPHGWRNSVKSTHCHKPCMERWCKKWIERTKRDASVWLKGCQWVLKLIVLMEEKLKNYEIHNKSTEDRSWAPSLMKPRKAKKVSRKPERKKGIPPFPEEWRNKQKGHWKPSLPRCNVWMNRARMDRIRQGATRVSSLWTRDWPETEEDLPLQSKSTTYFTYFCFSWTMGWVTKWGHRFHCFLSYMSFGGVIIRKAQQWFIHNGMAFQGFSGPTMS